MAVYGYLRVITLDQDNDKFKLDLLDYANRNDMGQVEFVEEKVTGKKHWKQRKLGDLLLSMVDGDILLVPELFRLARSISQIYEIIEYSQSKKISIHVLKQNMKILPDHLDMTTKVMLSTFSMIAELERDFISIRTKEALSAKKRQGVQLGRPRGKGKSRLDQYKDGIIELVRIGVPKNKIASRYNISYVALNNWLNVV